MHGCVHNPTFEGSEQRGLQTPHSWLHCLQALLGDTTFMAQLQQYDKDNIPPAYITAVRPYLERPELLPDTVKKASKAAYGLCCWVRAMEAYDRYAAVLYWGQTSDLLAICSSSCGLAAGVPALARHILVLQMLCDTSGVWGAAAACPRRVAKVVAPKKAALKQAEAEYATLMEGLAAKKAELAAVVAALDALNTKLGAMQVGLAGLRSDKPELETIGCDDPQAHTLQDPQSHSSGSPAALCKHCLAVAVQWHVHEAKLMSPWSSTPGPLAHPAVLSEPCLVNHAQCTIRPCCLSAMLSEPCFSFKCTCCPCRLPTGPQEATGGILNCFMLSEPSSAHHLSLLSTHRPARSSWRRRWTCARRSSTAPPSSSVA
jgi:hypothetical protein